MIPGRFYLPIFIYSILILTFIYATKISSQNYNRIKSGENNFAIAFIICIAFALFLGGRPIYSGYFGDSNNYALTYYRYGIGLNVYTGDEGEWLWAKMMSTAAQYLEVSTYFTIVDILYFGFTLWTCKRICPNNIMVALLFMLGAFSFYTYGTNGIRNGLACSIVLLAISYMIGVNRNLILALVLSACAFAIHKTTILPTISLFVSVYMIKQFKWIATFWILSIIISFAAGGAITSFFASFGFDDRVSYLTASNTVGKFNRAGFRWDFLIYSMMPILLGYYVVIKRGIRNKYYEILLNTYTLSNAFWVMVIRANYSNRFAYLSWFMYPLVLVYPLLKLNVWGEQQGKRTSQIMIAHIGFTWFMEMIYYT